MYFVQEGELNSLSLHVQEMNCMQSSIGNTNINLMKFLKCKFKISKLNEMCDHYFNDIEVR